MLFTGWEVLIGRNCARGLEYSERGHSFPNTDQPRSMNNIIQLRFKSVRKIFLYVEVGRICVDEAGDRLQTKTKHYNMTLSLVIILWHLLLSFRIKKGFCALQDNS